MGKAGSNKILDVTRDGEQPKPEEKDSEEAGDDEGKDDDEEEEDTDEADIEDGKVKNDDKKVDNGNEEEEPFLREDGSPMNSKERKQEKRRRKRKILTPEKDELDSSVQKAPAKRQTRQDKKNKTDVTIGVLGDNVQNLNKSQNK